MEQVAKNLKDIERFWGLLEEMKELYEEAGLANKNQTKGEENREEVIITQNSIPLKYSDEENKLIMDEGANTSNMFGKKGPREIMQ